MSVPMKVTYYGRPEDPFERIEEEIALDKGKGQLLVRRRVKLRGALDFIVVYFPWGES